MPAAIFIIFLISLFGCTHSQKTQKKLSAKKIYGQSLAYKKSGKLSKALKTLGKLQKNSLYDSYTPLVTLLIADIHFEQEDYILAGKSYLDFQKVYPKTKRQYVRYQLGRSYFYQLPSAADKDLSKATLALENFRPLLKKSSPYKKKAKTYVRKIKNLLAERDFQAVVFYMRKDWNQSAFDRLQSLIKEYPKSPRIPKALLYSYELAKKLGKKSKRFKKRLLKQFPKSKEATSL